MFFSFSSNIYGGGVLTDYVSLKSYIPNFCNFNTIVFLSSMMFAFAGLEISTMIVSTINKPKYIFTKSILLSALIIVCIYIFLTFCLNAIYPAHDTSILNGYSVAIKAIAFRYNIKYIDIIFEISLALGVLAQVNSWLLAPMQMLSIASKRNKYLYFLSKIHKKYKTPINALIFQALLVCILLSAIVLNKNIEHLYYSFISLCSLCYFIPYLVIFPSYLILRQKQSINTYKIYSNIISYIAASVGFLSVLFAIILILIPPKELNISDTAFLKYELSIFILPILLLVLSLFSLRGLNEN
ncbi:amino acid permease [Campylobacter canadensis]|uniref:APC family permease n=1 Tax=Campylobacter canadensis TaxID=449520 RepID=UPI00295EED3E|nr:APC family permease [Campylobacter canadensis]MBZ7997023.1 amino acid permease [Campylobacter canadensis]